MNADITLNAPFSGVLRELDASGFDLVLNLFD